MICIVCGEPCELTFWGLKGDGGVCRNPFNPNDDDEGQHVAVPVLKGGESSDLWAD